MRMLGGKGLMTTCLIGLLFLAAFMNSVQAQTEALQSSVKTAAQDKMTERKVRVQLKWRHQFQFAGYYAALEKGFYRDAGLDVELLEVENGVVPIDQLMGGAVDFAVADTGALIYRSVGVPIVALASIFQHSPSILMTRGAGDVTDLADLRGRRVMLSGGYMNAELVAMLQAAGLSLEDVELVPDDTSVDALVDGKTDAYNGYLTNEPFGLENRGVDFQVFAPMAYGVDFYGDTLFTTEAKITNNSDLVEDFRAATLRGWSYAVEHPEEIVDLILKKYNSQGKSRAHLMFEARQSIELILPNVVPLGYMNIERWERIAEIFTEQGRLKGPVEMRAFLHPSDDFDRFVDVLYRQRENIGAAVILVIAVLLVLHIASLRIQIRARTAELEVAKKRAEEEARTDALTGLPNRRCFFETASRDIERIKRNDGDMSVLVADIDFFKEVNDTYGHVAGDHVLRKVSEVLKRNVRAGDVAARIGGDEFAFCCPDSGASEAEALAKRLRDQMATQKIDYDGSQILVTLSLGYAQYQPGQSLDELVQNADAALYDAKRNGRNTIGSSQNKVREKAT
ncbi:MAG: GGDEF domain-containing protein [Rhodospirillales bacterium]|nr:GGDEF domain-containing protein [Rhodospirillales bacterium]